MPAAREPQPSSPHTADSATRRLLRYAWRLPAVLLHVLVAIPCALLVASAWGKRTRADGSRPAERITRWWSATLIRRFGLQIESRGEVLSGPVMVVANHVSWLDIVLINSQRATGFVAKSEIARWPGVGWLAGHAGTIYHQRGNTDSLVAVMEQMVRELRAGNAVGVFPEGGSGDGSRVRTFHARIFQAALDAQAPIQPAALRYGRDGMQDPRVPFARGEGFFPNFFRLLGAPPMTASIEFLAPVPADSRRAMAAASRAGIVAALGLHDA